MKFFDKKYKTYLGEQSDIRTTKFRYSFYSINKFLIEDIFICYNI